MAAVVRLGGVLIAVLLAASGDARGEPSSLSSLPGYDQYNGVVSDGRDGYLVVGAQETEKQGETVGRLVHFGPDRTHLLDATLRPGGALSAALVDVVRLDGGDVVAAGWARPLGATTDVCWIVRISPNGQQRWSQTTSSSSHERCYFITQLPDGALLAGGRREDDASGKGAARGTTWRIDATTGDFGRPTNVACEGGATRCAFQDAAAFPDGSTVLVGWLTQAGRGDDDIWVVRRDASGKQTYSRQIGGPGTDLANAALAAADGRAVVVGYTTKAGAKAGSGVVIALANNGATVWSRELDVGSAGSEKLLSGIIRSDGSVIAVGAASEGEKAPFKGWVVQLSPDGAPIGERVFDEPTGGRFNAVAAGSGESFAAVGAARGQGSDVDGWSAWLELPIVPAQAAVTAIKIDSNAEEEASAIRIKPPTERTETSAYKEGLQALHAENYAEALERFNAGAASGDANAQINLADMYLSGLGVQQDQNLGFYWLQEAAEQGHRGAAKKLAEALERFNSGAANGDANAQTSLADMYFSGFGVQKDESKGFSWLQKAAEQGHRGAAKKLANNYIWRRNYKQGIPILTALAEEGDVESQVKLAGHYESGSGVRESSADAAVWYGRASDQGNAYATERLASLYLSTNGRGLKRDWEKANILFSRSIELYKQQIKNGDPQGSIAERLGYFYESAIGGPRDLPEAKKWYRQAVENGSRHANDALARVEAAEREEKQRRHTAAMRDYRGLQAGGSRERLQYLSGDSGDVAVDMARMSLMKSPGYNYQTVLRVNNVSGKKAEADWPLQLRLEDDDGNLARPGWFLVDGELSPDDDPGGHDGLPIGTLAIFKAVSCEREGCSSPNDLIAMVQFHHGLADWKPE